MKQNNSTKLFGCSLNYIYNKHSQPDRLDSKSRHVPNCSRISYRKWSFPEEGKQYKGEDREEKRCTEGTQRLPTTLWVFTKITLNGHKILKRRHQSLRRESRYVKGWESVCRGWSGAGVGVGMLRGRGTT